MFIRICSVWFLLRVICFLLNVKSSLADWNFPLSSVLFDPRNGGSGKERVSVFLKGSVMKLTLFYWWSFKPGIKNAPRVLIIIWTLYCTSSFLAESISCKISTNCFHLQLLCIEIDINHKSYHILRSITKIINFQGFSNNTNRFFRCLWVLCRDRYDALVRFCPKSLQLIKNKDPKVGA